MDKANKVSLPRQGIILGLRLYKWTIFEPETPRIFVPWMASRGDMEIQRGENAGCSGRDMHPRHAAPSRQNLQVPTITKMPEAKLPLGLNPDCL